MHLQLITEKQKAQYKKLVNHIMQSWEWGQFRKAVGTKLLRFGLHQNDKLSKVFQLTLHPIPFTKKYVGYLPKGPFPNKELAEALKNIGQENNCAFIKVEPNVIEEEQDSSNGNIIDKSFLKSPKPLFTKYNFVLDLTKSEEELLKNMHPKTRYNIKVAQKHEVKVEERVDDQAFEIYLKLYFETTKRQGYFGHNENYHRQIWTTLKDAKLARLLIAFYQPPGSDIRYPVTAWMIFNFKDTLYYPYGGSSKLYPEVMANNLVAWEAIKLGKKLKLKKFDLWGALGPNATIRDPWYGFHRFKAGYGGKLVQYLGTFDLVFDYPLYWMFTIIDKLTPLKVYLLTLLKR